MKILSRVPGSFLKGASLLVTGIFVSLAVIAGGGTPPSPQAIASAASDASDNLDRAQANVRSAVSDTEALATIARNVESQLQTSEELLETQLEIEQTSKEGLGLSRQLADSLAGVGAAIEGLERRLRRLSRDSDEVTESSASIRDAAVDLDDRLDRLIGRFRVVTRESRELNRKARGFEEVRP